VGGTDLKRWVAPIVIPIVIPPSGGSPRKVGGTDWGMRVEPIVIPIVGMAG